RVPALERREQRRVRVDDRVRIRVVDGLVEHGAETGHGDEIDVVLLQDVDDLLRVRSAVEVGAEGGALDELGRDTRALRALERRARTIGDDHRDRQLGVDERLEDGATARRQDPETPAPLRPHGRASLDDAVPGAVIAAARRSATAWKLVRRTATDGGRGSLK